ncbi:MAG TPA: heavy metal translocating P-type ATPase, partial [Acholeplasma sp.]|nr:heavy metal translocating P-type ATPase [Acholeplasma sp.]
MNGDSNMKENHLHKHNHSSHDHHHHHGDFKKVFFITLPFGLLVMWLSPLMGINIPFPFHYSFKYSDIIALILSIGLLIYGGKPFILGAIDEFKQKSPGMMALVSMGLLVSFIYSFFAIIFRYINNVVYMDFLFEFSSLILIMLLGHWIEMVALTKAGNAKESLAKLLPKNAFVKNDNNELIEKPINELKINDIIIIQAGENIAADGIIISGESRVNESLLTGESKPIQKNIGDEVIGGTTNEFGKLEVKVTKLGKDSFLTQVENLINDAENMPSRAEDRAKKVASNLFYIALSTAIISFIVWFIIKDLNSAIMYAVTTLVIACPHALGLAIPLVISRSTSLGSINGILVKNRESYNLTSKADVIILDKTGTLTTGEFSVQSIDILSNDYKEEDIVSILAGIETGSSHPIANSIINYANEKNVKPLKFDNINILSGIGLKGNIKNDQYKFISEKGYNEKIKIENDLGYTISILLKNNDLLAVVKLGDSLKESSKSLMNNLKKRNIKPIMATGDNETSAKVVAEILDIDYYSNMSPNDKYKLVKKYKNDN